MPQKLTQSFVTKKQGDGEPVPTFKFWVEIKNIVVAEFKECAGLSMEREVERVEEGGVNDYVHVLPGRVKYSNITLKYGIIEGGPSDGDVKKLWNWFVGGLYDGKVTRVDFSILLRDVKGDVVRRWSVSRGFPVKWEGPQLNTEGNQVAIETLEIAHEGLKLS